MRNRFEGVSVMTRVSHARIFSRPAPRSRFAPRGAKVISACSARFRKSKRSFNGEDRLEKIETQRSGEEQRSNQGLAPAERNRPGGSSEEGVTTTRQLPSSLSDERRCISISLRWSELPLPSCATNILLLMEQRTLRFDC